ncbi:MAG: hypothetical protein NTY07_00025 [Bacteroidia bacterium]|nr:hypothetical protein [Bacteroidia bacterium]
MKKLAFISGALSGSLSGLGVLFRIVQLPGVHILLILGLGLFSLIFVPSAAKYLYDKFE